MERLTDGSSGRDKCEFNAREEVRRVDKSVDMVDRDETRLARVEPRAQLALGLWPRIRLRRLLFALSALVAHHVAFLGVVR
jgi:hypothetical protein